MKNRLPYLLLALICFFAMISNSFAKQKTGLITDSVTVAGKSRTFIYYVPSTYDSTKKYDVMVCLHGLGDKIANYSTNTATEFEKTFQNTIFIYAETVPKYNDYYYPIGAIDIISSSYQLVNKNYNIDTSQILLQGFSFGGRCALKYGLEHPNKIKGLLLNTPAIQGMKELKNKSAVGFTFKYDNAQKMPIFMTVGTADDTYIGENDSLFHVLVENNAQVNLVKVKGMGHNIPTLSKYSNILFNNQLNNKALIRNAEIIQAKNSRLNCSSSINLKYLIRNFGNTDLSSIDFNYVLNGKTSAYTWNGKLKPYQSTIVSIPATLNSASIYQNSSLKITKLEGTITVADTERSSISDTFKYYATPYKAPYRQSFENSSIYQRDFETTTNGDYFSGYGEDNTLAGDSSNYLLAFNSILVFDNSSEINDLLSPPIDLSTLPNPVLTFLYSFNYLEYTPPYTTKIVDFSDTMEYWLISNCGANRTLLFRGAGKDIATKDKPIVNALQIGSAIDFPTKSSWKKTSFDLTKYKNLKDAQILIRNISGLGGTIAIDRFQIIDKANAIEELGRSKQSLMIYPNPAMESFSVIDNNNDKNFDLIQLIDFNGKIIQSLENNSGNNINISNLSSGIYLVKTIKAGSLKMTKILVSK